MATSGSTNYSVTRNDVITEALELVGVIPIGSTPRSEHITSAARTLNMMIKHWQSRGVALWKNKSIYIFLEQSEDMYSLGPSGDHATATMVKTEVATAQDSGETTIVVDSISGISASDYIGVELDGGDLQWTTVDGAPSGSTITLAAALTDDVSVDAHVYTYTTGISRPLFLTEGRLHTNAGYDQPLTMISRNDYMALSTKTTTGSATQFYYDPQTTDGSLYVWPTASTVKDYFIFTARMPLDDFDSSTDNPDFPQEWLLPLAYNLAVLIAPKFDEQVSPTVIGMAGQFLQDAMDSAVDFGSLTLEFE